jgi:hypothetical protein
MKRRWRLVGLFFSHLVVFVLFFALAYEVHTRRRFRAQFDDPLVRVGMQISGEGSSNIDEASFNEDLKTIAGRFPAPVVDVIRLQRHLKDAVKEDPSSFAEAGRLCRVMSWQKCEQQDLLEMKRMLEP